MSASRLDFTRGGNGDEATFHDARVEHDVRAPLRYAYASMRDVYSFTRVPPERCGGHVLEIGCFRGARARALHGFTGRYTGIDISAGSVAHCQGLGLPDNFSFLVEDANVLAAVEPASVDYAFGDGVLHHLELDRHLPALARVLAPGGCARFIEPAQGNLALRLFRRLTPALRTRDEHPFDAATIALLQRHFEVEIRHEGLLRPWLPMLVLNRPRACRWARRADAALLRRRALQGQAWMLLIELRPRRAAASGAG